MLMSLKQESILMCQLDQKPQIMNPDKATITESLLNCLNEAVGGDFELIMISFSIRQIRTREAIIDLCTCLKNNSLTCHIPLFAIMTSLHRTMAVKLQRAGVYFIKIQNPEETPIDPAHLLSLVHEGDASVCIERLLSRLCPYLNYNPIDEQREIITCRACRNRMVLGGKRLHEICESEGHLYCHYFLNPKAKP